jgi:hypothetical protein
VCVCVCVCACACLYLYFHTYTKIFACIWTHEQTVGTTPTTSFVPYIWPIDARTHVDMHIHTRTHTHKYMGSMFLQISHIAPAISLTFPANNSSASSPPEGFVACASTRHFHAPTDGSICFTLEDSLAEGASAVKVCGHESCQFVSGMLAGVFLLRSASCSCPASVFALVTLLFHACGCFHVLVRLKASEHASRGRGACTHMPRPDRCCMHDFPHIFTIRTHAYKRFGRQLSESEPAWHVAGPSSWASTACP